MIKEIKICDIQEREHNGEVRTVTQAVVFNYDQEDGKSKQDPYFSVCKFEICEKCKSYQLNERKYVYAYGAMGHNKFFL